MLRDTQNTATNFIKTGLLVIKVGEQLTSNHQRKIPASRNGLLELQQAVKTERKSLRIIRNHGNNLRKLLKKETGKRRF